MYTLKCHRSGSFSMRNWDYSFCVGLVKYLIVYKWKTCVLLLGFAFGVQQLHPALIQRPFG